MKRFRLTPMQEAMLYETISDPSRYITVLRYELLKPLDVQTLSQRFSLLVQRHEALRTTFVRDDNGAYWNEITDCVDDKLFRIDLNGNELAVTFHHALLDGWSIGVLMHELLSEEAPEGSAAPFRYYVKWFEKQSGGLDWWKEYLGGERVCPELPQFCKPEGYERREQRFVIENSAILGDAARELGITAGRLIEAVWCTLIARYNGGKSLVCAVNAGRSAPVPGITGMVGMCVNTLPVLTELPQPPESISFADWVRQWSRSTAEAEKRGGCHLGELISGSLPHILSIDPCFDGKEYRLKSSSARLVSDFDAVFTLGDTVAAEFAYNASAYSDEAVGAVRGHFLTALNAVLDNPQIALEQIPILTGEEISLLTATNNDSNILDIIDRQTVVDLWRESAFQNASDTALVCGGVRLSYAELGEKANKLASSLKAKGVGSEIPAAILLPRSERYIIAELAIFLAGGFFIPLDPEWPKARIQAILEKTKPLVVIDEEAYEELIAAGNLPYPKASPKPADAAYMIMTSGTTGVPKGVVIEHRSLANFCLWAKERYEWRSSSSYALELGFAFDGSMWSIWPPLISGGTIHVLLDEIRFDLGSLGNYCRTNHITHIDLPVTLTEAFREIYRGVNQLPDLRVMVTGGEEVRRVVSAPYALSNEYGPTECTVCCSAAWINESNTPVTIGQPVPNMNAYILDEWNRLCPDGVTGQAVFSGVQVARGYYNAPELTSERFISNSFADGDSNHNVIYRTGDLMKQINCGGRRELVFAGRTDNQIKLGGFRIELAEIENVLLSHPKVVSAVAGVSEKEEKQLCAYVVTNAGLDISELDALLASKLPEFMHPTIIFIDKIPLTSSGKVDFKQLTLLKTEKTAVAAPPETENERVLLSVVAKLLGVSDIGTNHHYLALGGNSINAMRISFQLEKAGFMLSAKELITSGSIAEAAARMRQSDYAESVKKTNQTTFTPLASQQAMVFLSETAGSAMYTVTAKLPAPGLDMETLKNRIRRAAELHDILRTAFKKDKNGNITGRVGDSHNIRICTDGFGDANGIDPLRDPLLSLVLKDGTLTIRYHHIALDGHSFNLLVEELLYGKFPETAASFAEFANRLNGNTARRTSDEKWWLEACRNAKAVRLLPPKTGKAQEYKRIAVCSPELLSKCTETARLVRVTPAAFMLTAWSVVVAALSGEDGGVLIPFVSSCRDDDALMGMCAETRPLVFNQFNQENNGFAELAGSVQNAMLESISHWFVPQVIIGGLPEYLFVFEDYAASGTANGEQNYDLVVKFSDRGELIYNAARLPDEYAGRIAEYLEAALNAAACNRVSVLTEGGYKLITETFAHGGKLCVKHKTAAQAFTEAAEKYAGHIALETENESFTYSELYEKAKTLAHELNSNHIGKGDIAAFCLPRNAEGIIAQLGITLSGAAFLPLDPAWPQGRITDILRDSGAAAIIKDGLNIEHTSFNGKVPPDTVYIIYTSGTTGKPKGAILPQAALANQIAWTQDEFGFESGDRILHYINFTFDPSVWVVFTALASGAAICLLSEAERLDPSAAARYITDKNITRCTLPSAVAPDILRCVGKSALRTVFLGGEQIRNLPDKDNGYEIINLYGPTEACINSAFYRLPSGETETCIIGRPVSGTSCYVLDIRGEPCAVGIRGELYLGGAQLANGYLNRPDESAAAFIEHPHFGRLYKTGDRAFWNKNGTLTFCGRTDSQVKIRGNRVELTEIEYALRELPGVSDAKVVLRDGAPEAYIIGTSDISPLKKRLPSYMLPRSVTVMEAFPLTENGKLDVSALPAPSIGSAEAAEPLTELESAVASAWKTALGLAPDFVISRGDSFNDLGGHSLLLFHVVGLLSASGVNADVRTLIEHDVLTDLAEALERRETKHTPKALENSGEREGAYRLYVREIEQISLTEERDFRNVLITGGTGILGSHLLREFYEHTDAMLHVPIRGDSLKLKGVLEYYFGALGAEMAQSGRIHAFPADISEKPPDIDVTLGAIFHTAADIRHYAPEPEMYRANVTATENMLALAERNPKALFAHISTTSAVNSPVIYESDTDLGPEFENIYQRTKQLAEQRVLDAGKRGLKYAVFRVGHVSPGFENGSVSRNWEINAMLRLTDAMLLTGLLPEQDYEIGYGYVDKTASAIRLLSTPVNLEGHIFHIDNPNTLRLSEIFRLAGIEGKVLRKAEIITRLTDLSSSEDMAVRQAASEYLGRLSQGTLEKDSPDIVAGKLHMEATLLSLERLGFKWPHMTAEYIQRIIYSLKNKGGMQK